MNIAVVSALAVLLSVGLTVAHVHRGLYVMLLLLPASQMLGFVDPMLFAAKGVFDVHALLAILILVAVLFSFTRWRDLRRALLLKPMLMFATLWLYGVFYPVTQGYSSLFYALKGSKEFLTVFAYFAVFLYVRTESEVRWGWRILIGFGVYTSLLELAAQIFGPSLLSHMVYSYRKEISFMWKIYPPFWPVLLIALLHAYYEYALGVRRAFVQIGIGSLGLLLTFYRSYLLATVVAAPILSLFARQSVSRVAMQGVAMAALVGLAIVGVWFVTADRGGNMEALADHFVSSGITEFDTQTGGAIVGRERFAKERRRLLEQSPYIGFGFIDKESQFGRQVRRFVKGETLGFIDKGDVDVALKFGYVGQVILYGTALYMAYVLVRLTRSRPTQMLCVRALTLASLLIIFLLVQPIHAAFTYSFGLLPLGIALGLFERERLLHLNMARERE